MAYRNGQQIRPFDNAKGPSHVGVRIGGTRQSVEIRHVSRETMNKPPRPEIPRPSVLRELKRWSRKARMRLRKRRGWR